MATPIGRTTSSTPRSLLNFIQCHTFLALVEECSVARASLGLGIGQATVSNHIKAIEEELGRPQFDRFQGGMIATSEGLDSYARIRSLLERAVFAFHYFGLQSEEPLVELRASLPR